MSERPIFEPFATRLREFIGALAPLGAGAAARPGEDIDGKFNALALELFGLHYAHNPAYRRLCRARNVLPLDVTDWRDVPAVPAVGFKELEMTLLCPSERTTVFCSSRTTGQKPGRHFHRAESLALYEESLLPWFQAHLLPETLLPAAKNAFAQFEMVSLTPPPSLAIHSSLVHMLEIVGRRFALGQTAFVGTTDADDAWLVDLEDALAALARAIEAQRPVLLLGTAFGFVHLLDGLEEADVRLTLLPGSRIMETGGYKGRSRALPQERLHALIDARLGIPASHIVCEYGMSELSSQAYDGVAGSIAASTSPVPRPASAAVGGGRIFHFPTWTRARVISPETGREVSEGARGLLQVLDLANVASAPALQTEDLAVRRGAGFELLGRANGAEPRGCSLMAP